MFVLTVNLLELTEVKFEITISTEQCDLVKCYTTTLFLHAVCFDNNMLKCTVVECYRHVIDCDIHLYKC